MDASGLVSGPIFAASLLVLTYLNLADHSTRNRSDRPDPRILLGLLRSTITITTVTAGVALLIAVSWASWTLLLIFGLVLVVILAFIREFTRWLVRRNKAVIRKFVSPLALAMKLESTLMNGHKLNGSHSFTADSKTGETVQAVITEEAQATLDEREQSMIHSILKLDQFNARDIMIPRGDITAIERSNGFSDVAQLMLESGHSRLPVYQETMDRVVGIVHSRDLLSLLNSHEPRPPLDQIMRKPFFVPETKRLDEMLTEFQRTRMHMALVVDEHGGIEGLVTLEDLLEEIVGEIEDEFSTMPDSHIIRTEDGSLLVDARVSLNDLGEHITLRLSEAEVDTVGGLVYSELGKMPHTGDEVEYGGLTIKVLSTIGRRLGHLKITQNTGST
ncbi:HlyC/CorC family transporter [SAR202 cluster bacterium AD-804-J14_MRT_500m]|nr:HlyC/CorC family transporter [SAR202 cluster bacterium AD-804-J14_MRT_500m]